MPRIIGEVVSAWTGIPVGKMNRDEISNRPLAAHHFSANGSIGQMHAPRNYRPAVSRPRGARLDDPNKPVRHLHAGLGPSGGVGNDRNRACPLGPALRRRAQPDHDQHVGVSGSAHCFNFGRVRLRATWVMARVAFLRNRATSTPIR